MAITTISKQFAIDEIRRNELRFWDIYTNESSGVVTCNQNPDSDIETSILMLEKAFSEIKSDRIKLKASKYSREEKGRSGGLKNGLDAWVELNTISASPKSMNIGVDASLLMLLEKNYELRLELERQRLAAEAEENKTHPMDGLAHTLLTDPVWKAGIMGALNRLAGNPTTPIQKAPENLETVEFQSKGVNKKALEVLENSGVNINELLEIVAEYELKNKGAVNGFKASLQNMGVTGKNI